MNPQQQYQQTLHNRQARGSRNPLADGLAERMLAAAAQAARRRERAETAWAKVARPEWRAETQLVGVDGETAVVMVKRPAMAGLLRRQAARLSRELGKLVGGIRRVRFATDAELAAEVNPPDNSGDVEASS